MKHLVVPVLLFLVPAGAGAAELYFEPVPTEPPGFIVQLAVKIDRDVNAFEGVVRYDATMVEPVGVRDGGGFVPLWVERPQVTEPGAIAYAGIVPGGLQRNVRDRIVLFEVSFAALREGSTQLTIEDASVFLNDGAGTPDDVTGIPLTVTLGSDDVGSPESPEDVTAPEPFTVTVVRDAPLDGKRTVAVYSTRDFQSGMAGFEARQRLLGFPSAWQRAESPFRLSSWWLFSIIEVRATDIAGNGRVERVVPTPLTILAIVLVGSMLFLAYRRTKS